MSESIARPDAGVHEVFSGGYHWSVGTSAFSEDEQYRYLLTRDFYEGDVSRPLVVIGLNPSTADAEKDDRTIAKLVRYAKRWGFGSLTMLNLFAFRATDPHDMRRAFDPIGKQNDEFIRYYAQGERILCAWGAHGDYMARGRQVASMLREAERPLFAFSLTENGNPVHPLYLRDEMEPLPWDGAYA